MLTGFVQSLAKTLQRFLFLGGVSSRAVVGKIVVLGLLLVVNTSLYYAFELEASYGYLAVITLLCMPFVIPTMSRCEEEVKKSEAPETPEVPEAPESPEVPEAQ